MGRRCLGCGALLQSDDPGRAGYVPPEKTETAQLCQRCFRIKHYGDFKSVSVEDFPFDEISKSVDLVCFIVDAVDIEGSWLVDRFEDVEKIWLVVNKTDLLPFSKEELSRWVVEEIGWTRKFFLISARKGWGLKSFWDEMMFALSGKRIAFMGATNVGKSSLLSRLLGDTDITVSPWPGTTIDVVERSLSDGTVFLDTPGIVPEGRLYDILCPNCQKKVIPSKKLSGKVFLLTQGRSLMLGGLVILSVEQGSVLVKPFISYEVPLHRTNKLRIYEILKEGVGDWLAPPCKGCLKKVEEMGWEEKVFVMEAGKDIAVSGIGWISFFKGEGKVSVMVPKGVRITVRRSIRR